jgi:hypothetical protein
MPTTPPIIRAFQWDLARQMERLDVLLKLLPRYAEWGYQELYLHLEDAVEYPSLPAVARPGAYSYAQFTRLVQAATAAGIRVVPIVNLLGHTQYLIKTPGLRDLNELRDTAGRPLARGQICPLHPRTPAIAEKLLRDMAPFCTAGKVHVGLDESFHLGQCPRCRAEVARVGLAGHFAGHVNRLHQLTQSLGLRLGLWADMLALLPAAIPQLPRDVIAYDWYYYPFARHPRVELHNFAEVDLATPLQARGIEYWGCPMNGAFRYEPLPIFGERLENIRSWWRRCRRVGAGGFLVTSWEANRLALELTTVVDAAAACLWLDPEVDDPREMLARGFARVFGTTAALSGGVRRPRPTTAAECRQMSRTAYACDDHPFSGYHRWQINDRWDVCAGREPLAAYEKQAHTLERLCRSLHLSRHSPAQATADARDFVAELLSAPQGTGILVGAQTCCAQLRGRDKIAPLPSPPALRASIAFRRYLAQRDVFVRRNARAVFRLRRLLTEPRKAEAHRLLAKLRSETMFYAATLRAGRAAARTMWNRSRDPQEQGPNELMLARDAERLRAWQQWLGKAARNHDFIWRATPVCGAWQLQFTLHNFAPALQKVVVEQRQADGSWRTLHGLYTIEFRAFAARPYASIRHEISVPVTVAGLAEAGPGSATPATRPLRLAVRGVGQVAVSHVELTDGVVRLHPSGWLPSRKKILGRPAPRRGFPLVDWTKNQDSKRLTFRPSRNSSQGTQSTPSRFRRSLPR